MDVIQPLSRPFIGTLCVTNSNSYSVSRYVFDTIDAGANSLFCLPVEASKGQLVDVKIQNSSEKFDFYILPFPSSKKDSISVIYEKKEVNKVSVDRNINCLWTKYSRPDIQHANLQDIDLNLYLLLENTGTVGTDEIIVEITVLQLA
jgi:hypothetical protein